jgi:hypothetical protein
MLHGMNETAEVRMSQVGTQFARYQSLTYHGDSKSRRGVPCKEVLSTKSTSNCRVRKVVVWIMRSCLYWMAVLRVAQVVRVGKVS